MRAFGRQQLEPAAARRARRRGARSALLWCTVRRRFGALAATFVAALVLALSPVNVAVNRLNLPEPFMILFLVAAAWAVLRSFDDERHGWWLVVLAGVLGRVSPSTPRCSRRLIPLPALGLAVLIGTSGGWVARASGGCRVRRGVAGGVAASWIAAGRRRPGGDAARSSAAAPTTPSGTWCSATTAWPASTAAGGGRVAVAGGALLGRRSAACIGGHRPAGGASSAAAARRPRSRGCSRSPWSAAWPPLWFIRADRARLASVVLWLGWLALYGAVFSEAKGTFHAYYTSAMAPGGGGAGGHRRPRPRCAWCAATGAWWAVVGRSASWPRSGCRPRSLARPSPGLPRLDPRRSSVVRLLAAVIAAVCAVA